MKTFFTLSLMILSFYHYSQSGEGDICDCLIPEKSSSYQNCIDFKFKSTDCKALLEEITKINGSEEQLKTYVENGNFQPFMKKNINFFKPRLKDMQAQLAINNLSDTKLIVVSNNQLGIYSAPDAIYGNMAEMVWDDAVNFHLKFNYGFMLMNNQTIPDSLQKYGKIYKKEDEILATYKNVTIISPISNKEKVVTLYLIKAKNGYRIEYYFAWKE